MDKTIDRDIHRLYCVGLMVIESFAIAVLAGCARTRPIYPSYTDLVQHKFYAYILPETETQQRQWREVISIWAHDFHCQYSDASNNLHIAYKDQSNQTKLELVIGHWNEVWDRKQKTTEVSLTTRWAVDGKAVFYHGANDSVAMKFDDPVGIPVQVWSDLSVIESVKLVDELEYVGPPLESRTDPWDNCR